MADGNDYVDTEHEPPLPPRPDTLEHRLVSAYIDHNYKLAALIIHELIDRAIHEHEAAHHQDADSYPDDGPEMTCESCGCTQPTEIEVRKSRRAGRVIFEDRLRCRGCTAILKDWHQHEAAHHGG